MAIESVCGGCGQTLSVPDEHGGKQARCPACKTIYTVPHATYSPAQDVHGQVENAQTENFQRAPDDGSAAELTPVHESGTSETSEQPSTDPFAETSAGTGSNAGPDDLFAAVPSPEFWMRTPEGTEYGPADQANLNRWFSEGRVGANYQIREGQEGQWQPASHFQPQTAAAPQSAYAAPAGHGGTSSSYAAAPNTTSASPYAAQPGSATPSGSMYQYEKADMSGLVMAMGILAWVLLLGCPVLGWIPGLVAWIVGRTAMQDIQQGKSDPAGFGVIQVGYYLGMANVILSAVLIVAGAGIFVLAILMDL